MTKGEKTHKYIIRQAGGVFNQFGYGSTPVSAIMQTTGLKKGGLYNHFNSKEELAIESFRYNLSEVSSFFKKTVASTDDPVERLRLLLKASLSIADGNVVPGGCPILNAAVESDDADPVLKAEASAAAERLRSLLKINFEQAINEGRIRDDEDADTLSFFFLSSLEGGIMLTKLHSEPVPLTAVIRMLNNHIDGLLTHTTK